ncbi:translation initiation factor IF-2-like [Schistocerca cancellata]|uniref:translation initiation factor IF-2-like n=1 Tax=Schistocerca cancellata TaxID=274614 RepID=UPI002117FFBB|nr:translation initiation factor IF-2-like [Schistocerca cancellata]
MLTSDSEARHRKQRSPKRGKKRRLTVENDHSDLAGTSETFTGTEQTTMDTEELPSVDATVASGTAARRTADYPPDTAKEFDRRQKATEEATAPAPHDNDGTLADWSEDPPRGEQKIPEELLPRTLPVITDAAHHSPEDECERSDATQKAPPAPAPTAAPATCVPCTASTAAINRGGLLRRQGEGGGKEKEEARRRRRQGEGGGKEKEEARRRRRQGEGGGKEKEEARRRRRQGEEDGKEKKTARRRRRQGEEDGKEKKTARRRRRQGEEDGKEKKTARRRRRQGEEDGKEMKTARRRRRQGDEDGKEMKTARR